MCVSAVGVALWWQQLRWCGSVVWVSAQISALASSTWW